MVRRRSFVVLSLIIFLLAGCASTPRITPAKYARIGLLVAYPDEATLSIAESFLGIPKGSVLPLPGLRAELTRVLTEKLVAAGYQVHPLPVDADRFWAVFDTAAKTKEGSSWHLGVKTNTRVTLGNLQQEGLVLRDVDAVLVVGPSEFYANARFLSRRGTGVELAFVSKTPDQVGCVLGANASAFDGRTLEFTGWGDASHIGRLGPLPGGRALTELTAEDKSALVRQLGALSAPLFEKIARTLR